MNPSREEALFALAREKSAAERAAFLARECAGDAALRRRVEALLVAHDQAVSSSTQPDDVHKDNSADDVRTVISERPLVDEAEGALIGRYKLLEKLGEGGFGAVWLAEQKEPVRRKVALKIIKLWDVGTRQELLTLGGTGSGLNSARWSADGDMILAGPPWQAWHAPSWEEIAAAEAKDKTEIQRP